MIFSENRFPLFGIMFWEKREAGSRAIKVRLQEKDDRRAHPSRDEKPATRKFTRERASVPPKYGGGARRRLWSATASCAAI
jgi:hypothetical protein